MEEYHDHAGLAHIEPFGNVHQHAAVIVGLVLPVDPAREAAVAPALAAADVQEWRVRCWIVAEIGKGRRPHADEGGEILARSSCRRLRLQRGDLIRRRLRGEVRGGMERKTLLRRRETVAELSRRKTLIEGQPLY